VLRVPSPGLAELTRGNIFRTRLYPLTANGSKRIAISFDQPLLDAGADYRYVLPLQLGQKVQHFKVHAEAIRAQIAPTAIGDGSALTFKHWQDSFVADLERNDFQPNNELAFAIPKPKASIATFAVPDLLEPQWRTFAAQVQSAAPADLKTESSPKHIALFYDASGSAAKRNRQRELDFLGAWLMQIKDVQVDLIAFRNDADPAVSFSIRGGESSALRKAIEALPIDGGSSYGAIRVDSGAKLDLIIVIGDGISNFGSHEPVLHPTGGSSPRLVVLHAAQAVDTTMLARLARSNGGQLINLLETDQVSALKQVNAARWMLLTTRVVHGECTDLAPAAPQPVGSTFSLYGRCRGAAELELSFGNGAGSELKRTLKLDDATMLDPERGRFVGRLWAVARITELENAANVDEMAITDLAKRFGVVTRNTSMLVLDRIEDYVRYKVEPREADLAAQYQSLMAAQPKPATPDAQNAQQLAQVLNWWTEFKKWHDTRHAWLETVLQPTAAVEVLRWRALPALKDSEKHLNEAQSLDKQANALQQRWLSDGSDPAKRAIWEHEAAEVMLKLDALRHQRLAAAPDSDQIKQVNEVAGRYQAANMEAPRSRAEAPMAMRQASPPPASPVAAAPVVAAELAAPKPVPGQAADAIATGGGRRRDESEVSKSLDDRKKEKDSDALSASKPSPAKADIELQGWDPNTPYLAKLRASKDAYIAYLGERERQASTPAFFLDCADYFRNEAKNPRIALRVLSNIAEIDFESAPLVRVLAYRLQQWDRFDLAVPLFEEAFKLRGEEPQSRRDLALALSRQTKPDYGRAVSLLWEVVSRSWDGRFPEIQTLALHELNDVLARAPADQRKKLDLQLDTLHVDKRLLDPIAVDLRVVLSWDADNTDIDLWVIDPTGEIAIYNQPRTKTGGHMSRDFTGGYGPEVFTIRRALPGTYVVKAHFYGNRQQKLTGAVTVQAEFLT
jgi:Ca-activated chloride channel homolog